VLVGAGLALFLVLGGDDPAPVARKKEPPPPPFAFTDAETEFIAVGVALDKVDEATRLQAAADVVGVMDAIYDAGFVTRSRWGDGTFPDVVAQFDQKASARAQENLAELTLGPESARVIEVTPGESTLAVSILLSKKEATGAVTRASFQAEATLKGGGTMTISHMGTYYLRPLDQGWKIVGFEVEGTLDSASPTAAPSPTGAAA